MASGSLTIDDYPRAAHRARGGTTRLHIEVGPNGRVQQCTVVESSRASVLDAQSCHIVRRWRFRPALDAAGRPVAETLAVSFGWTPPNNIRLYPPEPLPN